MDLGSLLEATGNSNEEPQSWKGAAMPRGYSDVTNEVELKGCDLLNAHEGAGTVRSMFLPSRPSALEKDGKTGGGGGGGGGDGSSSSSADDGNGKDWVQSSADEQMLLFIPFHAALKLHTIQITSVPPKPSGTDDDDESVTRPAHIKLYTNRPNNLDFSEADDTDPDQEIELTARDWNAKGTASLSLRYVKFQNVSSLILYVVCGEGEPGSDRTRIDRIRLIGEAGAKRVGKIEKVAHDQE